jgi:hypothetical protein
VVFPVLDLPTIDIIGGIWIPPPKDVIKAK